MDRPSPRLIRKPDDAEQSAAEWLRYYGYRDASVTTSGKDGGVDVEAAGIVAQVKAEMKPIGRPIVQQTFGIASLRSSKCAVFSLSGFTPEATEWADEAGVALFQFDLQGEPEPLNKAAWETTTAMAMRTGPWIEELVTRITDFFDAFSIVSAAWRTFLDAEAKRDREPSAYIIDEVVRSTKQKHRWAVENEKVAGERLWEYVEKLDGEGEQFDINEMVQKVEWVVPFEGNRSVFSLAPDEYFSLKRLAPSYRRDGDREHLSRQDAELVYRHTDCWVFSRPSFDEWVQWNSLTIDASD